MPQRAVAWAETVLLFAALYIGLPWTSVRSDAALGWPALPDLVRSLGVPLLVLGAAGLAWCFLVFLRVGGGTPNPIDPPNALVTQGPFAWTRNPIILSHALASFGVAFIVASPTMAIGVLAIGGLVPFIVRHEEGSLERRFGDAYVRYRDAVPRWIPRPPRRQS